jgi:hypothetical protein
MMSSSTKKRLRHMALTQAMMLDLMAEDLGMDSDSDTDDGEPPIQHRKRKRRFVNDIFNEKGPLYVRRAYRMQSSSFWELHKLLKVEIASSPNA